MYALTPGTVEVPTIGSYSNYGIWFDRDGVDPSQAADPLSVDGATYNTGGVYDVVINYHAINGGLGSMVATVNGIPTRFGPYPTYGDPAGLSFTGSMAAMQFFAGLWAPATAGGQVVVSDIALNGCLVPPPTVPEILSPANNSVLTPAQLTLIDWTDSTGSAPVTYQYQAFSNAAYTASVYTSGWLTASQIPTPGTPAGVYYVRVRAQDGIGRMSDWSNGSSDPYKITVYNAVLTALSPAMMWIGLKNSDDVGLKVDLQAVVKVNDVTVSTGELFNVATGSSGFSNAKLNSIIFPAFAPVAAGSGDVVSITVNVKNICVAGSRNSGTARLWFNAAAIDAGTTRDAGSRFDVTLAPSVISSDYFLRSGSALSTTAGTARTFVDMAAGAKCSAYKSFGTWSITLP